MNFSGVYAASLTPMHNDFSCNCEELAKHCQDLIKRGCNGVLLFGTTGEGASFTVEERIDAIKKTVQMGVEPQRLIVGISCSAIQDAVTLASAAIDLNCSAVLIVPPFFYKNVSEAGVIAFYREVIRTINSPGMKLILYHIPQFSGVPITLNTIRTLRTEFPETVIGIKESEGNLAFTKEILAAFPGFKVFVGNELQISEAVELGAAGAITGMVNVFPELIGSLYDYGKDKQKENNNESAKVMIQTIKKYPTLPAMKNVVAHQKGSAWHLLRPPLIPLNAQQSQLLIKELNASI